MRLDARWYLVPGRPAKNGILRLDYFKSLEGATLQEKNYYAKYGKRMMCGGIIIKAKAKSTPTTSTTNNSILPDENETKNLSNSKGIATTNDGSALEAVVVPIIRKPINKYDHK